MKINNDSQLPILIGPQEMGLTRFMTWDNVVKGLQTSVFKHGVQLAEGEFVSSITVSEQGLSFVIGKTK